MKRTLKIAGLALAMALGATSAQAAELDIKPYAGFGVGAFNMDAGFGSAYAVGGFGILGIDLHENFAAELRAGTTGNASVTVAGILPTENSADWFVSYLGKVKMPIGDQLGVYGLAGATTMKAKFATLGASLTKTTTSFSFGGGLEYDMDDQLHIGAEWVQYANEANATSPTFPGIDMWGISGTLRYNF